MAKKKLKQVEVKEFTKEDINAGLVVIHSEYFTQVLALLSYDKTSLGDVSFIKCPITTPDGGTYLVSILHVDGPKVNLSNLVDATDKHLEDSKS